MTKILDTQLTCKSCGENSIKIIDDDLVCLNPHCEDYDFRVKITDIKILSGIPNLLKGRPFKIKFY